MKRTGVRVILAGAIILAAALSGPQPAAIRIDYPEQGSLFPPDFAPPAFLFRDSTAAQRWRIEVRFAGKAAPVQAECRCEHMRVGEIDPRAVGETNKLPELTPEQAASRTWTPDAPTWEGIRKNSLAQPAQVTFTGYSAGGKAISQGAVAIETSPDPVGAPIFYRDVPLMPSELEKGIIKPLAPSAVPLIAWRLKNVAEPRSRVLMEGLHTCANCHSFSRDGKTLGMDLDGPRNDKGLYTLVSIAPRMAIRTEDVIAWSSFRGKLGGTLRVGFMSQVSPDGGHVVTMIEGPSENSAAGAEARQRAGRLHFYVANFKDYRFLQVFYPTRGILAWYSRQTGVLQALPGADDPRYVQTNAVWSPDGKYLVFARAEARDPYPEGHPLAVRANDPNETPLRYDLYRIPFNEGRGGRAEPVAGASNNGASNSFPKVSPDGRWIVFVQAGNGLLMRPDSRLYIVPASGGTARRMRANLPLMNSWHSFSPNGRWLVFSSKSRSPYTQMYLTHIDQEGRDSPAILVENTTASNRAVNIPEFVNIPAAGIEKIDVPAVEFYRRYDTAWELTSQGKYEEAVAAWNRALELSPADPRAEMNLGVALLRLHRLDEAIAHLEKSVAADAGTAEGYLNLGLALAMSGRLPDAVAKYEKALEIDGASAEVHSNLGVALVQMGRRDDGIAHYRRALELNPDYPEVHNNLAAALAGAGQLDEAILHFSRVVELKPEFAAAHGNLGRALAARGRMEEAIPHFEKALQADPRSPQIHNSLGVALASRGRAKEAVAHFEQALEANPGFADAHFNLADTLYYRQGDAAGALTHWRAALRIDPNHVRALTAMARVLATSPDDGVRNAAEAVALGERAARLAGDQDPVVLDVLAAAYAEAGRFPDALAAARRAFDLAAARNLTQLAGQLRERMAAYESGKTARER